MTNLTKMFVAIGCLLLLVAVVLRFAIYPIIIATRPIKPSSLLILANTAFILGVFFKK